MKNNEAYISVKIYSLNGDLIDRKGSHKSRRIYYFIQKDKYSNCLFELSVTYKDGLKNEANKKNQTDAVKTLKVFLEIC